MTNLMTTSLEIVYKWRPSHISLLLSQIFWKPKWQTNHSWTTPSYFLEIFLLHITNWIWHKHITSLFFVFGNLITYHEWHKNIRKHKMVIRQPNWAREFLLWISFSMLKKNCFNLLHKCSVISSSSCINLLNGDSFFINFVSLGVNH